MSNAQNLNKYLLQVQIFPTSRIEERSGVSEKTGKEWHIRTQEAYVKLGGEYPVQIKVRRPGSLSVRFLCDSSCII